MPMSFQPRGSNALLVLLNVPLCAQLLRSACIALLAWAAGAPAQTIVVDAAPEHATNSIRPTQALGAGVDRLPYGAADRLFNAETIRQVLSAGWQTVS
jgi:hypothetical protein